MKTYGQHDVGNKFILRHAHVPNSDTETQHFLELELDRRLDFGNLGAQVFIVREWGGEFAGCISK